MAVKHLMYVPWTGLGLYGGFRGNAWLKNRIKVFKQYVIPSLKAQTSKNFILWCSWRPEEKNNPIVQKFMEDMMAAPVQVVHTFSGVCFYDDKYEDSMARERLVNALHGSMGTLINAIGECDYVLMTIQPSDDCYCSQAVEGIQEQFELDPDLQAVGFARGYIINYTTKEVAEYNPTTNPPFYTIKFPREVFINPQAHAYYTSLKRDVGPYKAGTPLPSHEYVKDCLNYIQLKERGFLVGTHGANISTTWQIPFKGESVSSEVLRDFGVYHSPPVKLEVPLWRRLYLLFPYKVQRKLRYWLTEKFR